MLNFFPSAKTNNMFSYLKYICFCEKKNYILETLIDLNII